jgi:hypothetical protein
MLETITINFSERWNRYAKDIKQYRISNMSEKGRAIFGFEFSLCFYLITLSMRLSGRRIK